MSTFWQAVLYLHLVAMAFFLGGQLLLATAVVPALRGDEDRERLRAVARRFGWGSLAALGVLIATGSAMADHFDLWGEGTLHVKLSLVAVVVALVGLHLRYPRAHLLQAAIFLVSLAIVWARWSWRRRRRGDGQGGYFRGCMTAMSRSSEPGSPG